MNASTRPQLFIRPLNSTNSTLTRRLTSARLRCALVCLGLLGVCVDFTGCSGVPEPKPALAVGTLDEETTNPLFVETGDAEYLWNALVDTIDDYFEIAYETPIRVYKKDSSDRKTYTSRTEGRIDTKPSIAAGVCEPWRKNSANCADRWEASFQTIRRAAVVRVVPDGAGYLIYLSIYNEIEDMPRPMGSTIDANFNFNDDLSKLSQPVGEYAKSEGWIPTGRDAALETRILRELSWRLGNPPTVLHGSTRPLVP